MFGGHKESAYQAVDERHSDQWLMDQAVGMEKLLREQRQHVEPASGRCGVNRQQGGEVGLRRQLSAQRIAQSASSTA